MDTTALIERFIRGEFRALSRAISRIEDAADGHQEILDRLYPKSGPAVRIGVTGPPGAGKSTLVNCLAHHYLDEGKKVGIIAIDPSSPFTGGALLGDRVRMNEFPTDGRIFFRSMATRGASGGLAAATGDVSVVLDAFGFDIVLIETVGVGQIEIDIIDACDAVVVAVVPESGDAVQTLKAGLMEIANIMVVNKADRPGAESLVAELRQTLRLRKTAKDAWKIPVMRTEAVNQKGIDNLTAALANFLAFQKDSGTFDRHRRQGLRKTVFRILDHRFHQEFLARLAEDTSLDAIIDEMYRQQRSPFDVAEQLYARFSGQSR